MLAQIRKVRQEDDGFTLVELLIVIVILGVLASIVVLAVGGIDDNGKTSACKSDKKNYEVASESYRAKTGGYAADAQALVTAKYLRELHPANESGYTVTYNSDGSVTASC